MNSKVYKWCAVPLCKNTSITTPNKVFVHVPNKKLMREKWLKLARRDPTGVVTNSPIYFCEDHFDLPNDMENYMQYHLMGSVSQVRMKPGCIPTKFTCQLDKIPQTNETIEQPYISKKRKMITLTECEKELDDSSKVTKHFEEASGNTSSVQHNFGDAQKVTTKISDKSMQEHKTKFMSEACQAEVNPMTSPLNSYFHSIPISKNDNYVISKPSRSSMNTCRRIVKIEQLDSDISFASSTTLRESLPSIKSLQIESVSDCSKMIDDKNREELIILKYTLQRITKNPHCYIGLPKNYNFFINSIQDHTNIPYNHILLCLTKIRLNNSFHELGHHFAIDSTNASELFFKNIPILASVIRPFIVQLDNKMFMRSFPINIRVEYNNVNCIIDCVEIEVQKPPNAINQALSWSDHKKAYTMKYLVSYTPNGLVKYISPGYGGRITDTNLIESCDFIKYLQPGMTVMAYKGFKHLGVYLRQTSVILVRPTCIVSGAKLSKTQAKETKGRASLRIHIKQVIGRLRKFNMLKPHACLNSYLINVLDDVITIACGLINLQDSFINKNNKNLYNG